VGRAGPRLDATRLWLVAALFAGPAQAGFDQPVDGTRYPTAGLLEHREYRFQARVAPESSLLLGARAGFKERVQVGVFYGAEHLVDRDDVAANPHAGFEARVRILAESSRPAVVLGFSSQGWGGYDGDLERYQRKSPGFFAVASKNWRSFLGDLSLHGGVNYSLETGDGDETPDAFASVDWTIAGHVSLLCDVDAGWNDDHKDDRYGEGGGYVDAGVRAALGNSLSLMLVFSDLTGNLAGEDHPARELEIAFTNWF
jgi:hypothetical protein